VVALPLRKTPTPAVVPLRKTPTPDVVALPLRKTPNLNWIAKKEDLLQWSSFAFKPSKHLAPRVVPLLIPRTLILPPL
jgi:hypothetical protein